MHLFGKYNISYGQPGCALTFFTFTFKKHLRVAYNASNFLHTAYSVNSKNNNNNEVQWESKNTCTNIIQTNN